MKLADKDIVFEKQLKGFTFTFHSTWGLFSPKNIDEGTELLIQNLPVGHSDLCLDMGCGYGPVGLTMAKLAPSGFVHLVDKDFVAVEYAKKNAHFNRIKNFNAYLSNGFSHIPRESFDIIASNIPGKVGKELLTVMISDARHYLKKNGILCIVCISGLREFFKRILKNIFGNCEIIATSKTYTVLLSKKY